MDSMSAIEPLFAVPPYALPRSEKTALLLEELLRLTEHHRRSCEPYRRMLDASRASRPAEVKSLADLPFLPVRLFKELELQSVPAAAVVKTLTSSGTTSQRVSRIAVDRETSLLQTRALAEIIKSFIGPLRLPMIIVDCPATAAKSSSLTARGAGVVGLSNFGRDHFYALDAEMQLDRPGLDAFIAKHAAGPILIFGFTFMVWEYWCEALRKAEASLSIPQAILIHSGGWKRLQEKAVDNEQFKETLRERCGIRRVHNFYGMVEQVGSVYMECEHGHLHAPSFADILIRNPADWSLQPPGTPGVVQTLSVLPRSYPGHSLLTEDRGTLLGVDDCPCGRQGAYFLIHGRVPQAELRGCSDVHAQSVSVPVGGDFRGVETFIPAAGKGLSPEQACPPEFFSRPPVLPFAEETFALLDGISTALFQSPELRIQPQLAALAFWLRKANTTAMADAFLKTVGAREQVMPRGVAFHVAPSNVDTIFAYSWALSLLAGNSNVVRISQQRSGQLEGLLAVIARVFTEPRWQALAERNRVLSYGHEEQTSRYFSKQADVRVIWGGDATIAQFRALPAKPGTQDVVFADKHSHCAVKASAYVDLDPSRAAALAKAFHGDAYPFDQMACSSPRCVFFVGEPSACREASARFWHMLAQETQRVGQVEPAAVSLNKLSAAFEQCARDPAGAWVQALDARAPTVVHVGRVAEAAAAPACGGGFFLESFVDALDAIAVVANHSAQTLTHAGFSEVELHEASGTLCRNGFDRVVPVGQALVFSPVWDGYVLLGELTRRVTIA